jgi:hypothetical protein
MNIRAGESLKLKSVNLKGLQFIEFQISTPRLFSFTFNIARFSIVLQSYDYIISLINVLLPVVLLRLFADGLSFTWITRLPLGMIISVKFWQLGSIEHK